MRSLSEIFLVKISNTYEPHVKVRKKDDGNNLHGYGKKSIEDKVKKYGGEVKFFADQGWHHAIVVIHRLV